MQTVAVIDFETTGMSPAQGARATETAAVLVQDGKIVWPTTAPCGADRRLSTQSRSRGFGKAAGHIQLAVESICRPTDDPDLESQQGHPLQHEATFVVARTAAANWSTLDIISGKDGRSRWIPDCRLGDAMKRLSTVAAGAAHLLATDRVWAQNGTMMNGGMWGGGWLGGYGGIWGLAVLVIVVAALVAWAVKRK
jgi:hypothetical protein